MSDNKTKKTVYLSELVADSVREKLQQFFEVTDTFDQPEKIEGIMTRQVPVTRKLIERCPNLKVISMHGIGMDRIDVKAAEEHGIKVFNVPGKGAESVGELAAAYIMALSRNIKSANIGLREGRFSTFGPAELVGHEIMGKTLGLIGMGNISQVVARILKGGYQAEVLGYDPYTSAEKAEALGFEKVETLEDLFERSDFISISVPLTDSTRNMVNADLLSHAKKDMILVNTARGGIVDEDALYDALKNKRIGGAALDVTIQEPISNDHPLLTLENFLCSPHMGGSTYEGRERVGMTAADHLFEVLLPELVS